MSRTAKARLNELCNLVYADICEMSPRQRGAAIRAIEGLSTTNCGWILYAMRTVLRGLIDDASSSRELKARVAARKRRGR